MTFFIHKLKYINKCNKLEKIPDLSKWNIGKVKKMSYLFNECTSLKEKPDISSWNIQKEANIKNIFNDSLSSTLTYKTETNDAISQNISEEKIENLNINDILKIDSSKTIKPSTIEDDIPYLYSDCGRESSYLEGDTQNPDIDNGRNSSFLSIGETDSISEDNHYISDLNKKIK